MSSSSGLPVEVTSTNTQIATVIDNVVDILGAGETELIATQQGSGCFLAAEPISRKLNVKLITALEAFRTRETPEVYPNPTTDAVTISFDSLPSGDTKIRVLGSSGEILLTVPPFEERERTIDIGNLRTGVYIFEISNQTGITFRRILKF